MLKLGDVVYGKLLEDIDQNHWIISFQGKLIQVRNTTAMKFEKNKKIKLRVRKENPLELQVLGIAPRLSRNLDIKI